MATPKYCWFRNPADQLRERSFIPSFTRGLYIPRWFSTAGFRTKHQQFSTRRPQEFDVTLGQKPTATRAPHASPLDSSHWEIPKRDCPTSRIQTSKATNHTKTGEFFVADGRNPQTTTRDDDYPMYFIGVYTSQVVQDFCSINRIFRLLWWGFASYMSHLHVFALY